MSFLHDLPIAELISHYGYIAIFIIITLESAGLPLPGETVLLTSAAYAGSTGQLNIGLVVMIAATAAILGDNAGYWVGRRWGLPLLLRKGHLIGLDHGRLKLGQYLFRQHGGKIVFFGRFTAMLRAFAAVLAGVNKLDARQFFAFNALGGVAWASFMGFGAYLCGRSIENVMGPVGLGLLALVVLGAVGLWLFMRRHEARLMAAAEAAIPGPLVEEQGEEHRPASAVRGRGSAAGLREAQAERAPAAPMPSWFKLPVLLFLATVGMTAVSWEDGVTGGLYGRLAGSLGSEAVLVALLVPACGLLLIRWRLKNARPSVAADVGDADPMIRSAS